MKKSAIALAALSLLALCAASPAAAKLVTVSGSGFWAHTAPPTAYSAPDAAFSFSFRLPQHYSPGNNAPVPGTSNTTGPDIGVSTDFTNFSYTLGGFSVSGAPDDISFFAPSLNGGFALGYSGHSVEFIGPDIGSSGTMTLGHYGSFYPNIDYTSSGGIVTNEGAGPMVVNVVPEPAAWALSLIGFGAVGGGLRSRRKSTPLAA